MDRFRRARRDPASDTQFTWLAALFLGLVGLGGYAIFSPGMISLHGVSGGASPSPSPGPTGLGGQTWLVVYGLVGLVLGAVVVGRALNLVRGASTQVFEIDSKTMTWGFVGSEQAVSLAEVTQIDIDRSFGLVLRLTKDGGGTLQLPNLGHVVLRSEVPEMLAYLRERHPAIALTGDLA